MLKSFLLFLSMEALVLAQPFGNKFFNPERFFDRQNYESDYSNQQKQYLRPVAYSYHADPSIPQHEFAAKPYQEYNNYNNLGQKMVGEQFFKYPVGHVAEDKNQDNQELPYTLIKEYGTYEYREYPTANFACVKSEVDTSDDPMAGLENVDPFTLMSSKRWKKQPMSTMFKELFKYISGVNQGGHEVEMTRPVSTHHVVKKEQVGGDLEVQEMCFYIDPAHQANPPQPLESSPVYILKRPTMRVFVHRFGGFPLSSDAWQKELTVLKKVLGERPHKEGEYFTNGYNSPFELVNRRNEVWIQDEEVTKPAQVADPAVVVGEEEKPAAPEPEPEPAAPAEAETVKETEEKPAE